jgi:hypothetical protein
MDKPLTLMRKEQNIVVNGKPAGNLTIYRAEYCSAVVQHYAFKGNQVAQFCLSKFADMGVNTWIHGITGWNAVGQPEKRSIRKMPMKRYCAMVGDALDLVPDLDPNRKALAILRAAVKEYPEHASVLHVAISELESVEVVQQTNDYISPDWTLTDLIKSGVLGGAVFGLSKYFKAVAVQKRVRPTVTEIPNEADLADVVEGMAKVLHDFFGRYGVNHPQFVKATENTIALLQEHHLGLN